MELPSPRGPTLPTSAPPSVPTQPRFGAGVPCWCESPGGSTAALPRPLRRSYVRGLLMLLYVGGTEIKRGNYSPDAQL